MHNVGNGFPLVMYARQLICLRGVMSDIFFNLLNAMLRILSIQLRSRILEANGIT